MRQGILSWLRRGILKEDEKEGHAWMAGKELLPMLSDAVNPKMALL
jgi:hypothetical protein